MIQSFLKFIQEQNLFTPNTPVLLTVSGGMDSVVMAELFYRTKQNFGIAHCNFRLRGKESNDDEQFVKDLAARLGVKFFSKKFQTEKFAEEKKVSIQMAARELRYEWFENIRKKNGFHFIATAHHLNDSVETALLNFTKGTGIAGLHGILPKSGKVIRPLMFATRSEIASFAKENKIAFRTDSSNLLTKYERNKIRLEVIPLLKSINPNFEQSVANSIQHFRNAELLYNKEVERLSKKLLEPKENGFQISIGALKNMEVAQNILFETLKPFHFNESTVQQIIESLEAEAGKQFFSSTHRIIKDRKFLLLSPIESEQQQECLIEIKNQKFAIRNFSLEMELKENISFQIPSDNSVSCLDATKLQSPLLLRKWKRGDYFYPFGMNNKKKKVSDYLINKKIPLSEKENIYLLESSGKIACIIGERIDERFKIKPSTKNILLIRKMKK